MRKRFLKLIDLLGALKLECDVLFLGFGPITHAFAKDLIRKGYKVAAVTERSVERGAKSELSSDSFTIVNWQSATDQEITSESTYIGWRESPQNQPLGKDLIAWVKSSKMETGKLHHLSSASVYNRDKDLFLESDHDFRTNKVEMNSKHELEHLVQEIGQEKQTRFVNYRISNVYGSGLNQGFINESIYSIKNNRPIKLFKKVDLVRDYLLIDDLIEAFIGLRLNDFTDEALNLSSGHGMAISEIVSELQAFNSIDLKFIEVDAPMGILGRSVLSCERLEEIIPWKPIQVEESLKLLMQDLI
jgi:dTDP-D-glucose 4,6-dehydratase